MYHYQIYDFLNFIVLLLNNIYIKNLMFFIFGAILGSFSSMLIYRLPIILKFSFENSCNIFLNNKNKNRYENLNILTKSTCPNCNNNIPLRYNIPILGFLFLKGKCFYCKSKISKRYIFIELFLSISFLTIANLNFSLIYSLFIMIFIFILVIISIIDYNEKLIINELVYILMFIGFLFSNNFNQNINIYYSVSIFLFNYLFLKFLVIIMEFLLKKDTIFGDGDILLISVLCEFLLIKYIFIFYILIGILGLFFILIKKLDQLPLAPIISLSFFVVNII